MEFVIEREALTLEQQAMVDTLFKVRKQIKDLQKDEDKLKANLVALKLDEVQGLNMMAVITHVAETSNPDYKAIVEFAKIKPTVIAKFMKKAGYDLINLRPIAGE